MSLSKTWKKVFIPTGEAAFRFPGVQKSARESLRRIWELHNSDRRDDEVILKTASPKEVLIWDDMRYELVVGAKNEHLLIFIIGWKYESIYETIVMNINVEK